MLYIPATTFVVFGVSVAMREGRTFATVSLNGERVFTTPLVGVVKDKLFVSGKAVALTLCGDIKRGELVC